MQEPQSNLSIFLLPGGSTGAQAISTASSWADEGLLKRALWLTTDDVESNEFGGATAKALLLDQGQSSLHDLMNVLSRSRLELVTIVVVQITDGVECEDPLDHDAAKTLVEALENSRPDALSADGPDRPVDVVRLSLLAAPTGTKHVAYDSVAFRHFNANLIASPEDRRAADQMDRFVRANDNLVMWALAQAVTIGGAWSGMPEGPWRYLHQAGGESAIGQGDFTIPVRSFTRVVTSAPTARRAIALAMREIHGQQANVLRAPGLIPTAEPAQFLDATLTALDEVDGGRLKYQTPSPSNPPKPQKVRSGQAVKNFLRFSGTELAGIPRHLGRRSSAKWSARANKALVGDDGNELITVRGESPDLDQFTRDFERQTLEAQRSVDSIESALPPAAPELWRTVRATAFGLLDGSPIPAPIPTPIVSDQPVVIATTALIAPPTDNWSPRNDAEIPELDLPDALVSTGSPSQAQNMRDQMAGLLAETESEIASLSQDVEIARQELAVAEELRKTATDPKSDAHASDDTEASETPDTSETSDSDSTQSDAADNTETGKSQAGSDEGDPELWPSADPADSDSDPAAETVQEVESELAEPGPDVALLKVQLDSAKRQLSDASARMQALNADLESLDTWSRERDPSLLWRLTKRVQSRTQQAAADAKAFREEAVAVPGVDHEEPLRARNQFIRRLGLLFSVALIASLLLLRFGHLITEFLPVERWMTWAALVGIILLSFAAILLSNYRRRSRFVANLRRTLHMQRDAVQRCRQSAHAEGRLKGLHEQMVEWNELISYSIHDALQPEDSWFTGMPSAELAANLPTCVDLAVPDPEDAVGTGKLQKAALASIANQGWRSRTFNLLVDLGLNDGSISDDGADTNQIDMDAPATPNGSRQCLLEGLRSGKLQKDAARSLMQSKAASLYAERRTLMSHELRPVNSEFAAESTGLLVEDAGLELLRPRWGDFLIGGLRGNTQFSSELWSDRGGYDIDLRSSMKTLEFSPPGTRSESVDQGTRQLSLPPADQNRGVELTVRCDVGPPVEAKNLQLFSQDDLSRRDELGTGESASNPKSNGPVDRDSPTSEKPTKEPDIHSFN